jgi:hypothetical protein
LEPPLARRKVQIITQENAWVIFVMFGRLDSDQGAVPKAESARKPSRNPMMTRRMGRHYTHQVLQAEVARKLIDVAKPDRDGSRARYWVGT